MFKCIRQYTNNLIFGYYFVNNYVNRVKLKIYYDWRLAPIHCPKQTDIRHLFKFLSDGLIDYVGHIFLVIASYCFASFPIITKTFNQ